MEIPSQPKTKTRAETRAFYQSHFERYRTMNVNKGQYIKENNLIAHQFMYWTSKFERELRAEQSSQNAAPFIPVTLQKKASSNTPQLLCTLELGKEKRLLIHHPSALSPLLELLGE